MDLDFNEFVSKIIVAGLTGLKGSGKDVVGDYLHEKYGFIKVSFAEALKDICKVLFSFTDWQLYDPKGKETIDTYWKHTPREFFQRIGTELFRQTLPKHMKHIGSDIWPRIMLRRMMKIYAENPEKNVRFVVTDIRFPNELNFVKKMGGTVFRVNRHTELIKQIKAYKNNTWYIKTYHYMMKKLGYTMEKVHASERHFYDMDVEYDVDNYGTFDELYEKVDTIMNNETRLQKLSG